MLSFFLPLFLVFLFLGLPVFFALVAAPGLLLWLNGQERDVVLLYRNIYNGIDSFPLMAIPFFMLAGELMNRAGISQRIVGFATAMVGHFRGGLAQVNVVDSMLFAGISGSAVADVSALGSIIIPQMEKKGYPKPFAAAITAASAIIGPIIPPSGIMIIYAYVMGESVAALFLAGIVPGILIGIALMIAVRLMADRYGLPPARPKASWAEAGRAAMQAFWPLLTPVILMGGILAGVFTPTEAAAVAAGYCFFIGLFVIRTLKPADVPGVLVRAGITSAVVLLLVGGAGAALAQSITLRATATSNTEDEDYDGLVVFKNYVENASNGDIKVELFIGTQLCSKGEECLAGVAEGSIDIFVSTSGGAAGIFPYIQVLDLPYLMSDDRVAEDVLSGDFMRTLRAKAMADSGDKIRLMAIGNTGGWRNYANTKGRVTKPEDLKGLKMRTVPADLPQELARGLGAAPTPIAWPELFTSLQTGVVEGTANGITDIMNMKFPDAGLKYITLDGHSYMGAFWWMSNDRFSGLSDAQKRVVLDGFAALQQATFASPKRKEIAAYAAFKAAGGDIYVPTPEEKATFKAAAAPVFDWFKTNVKDGAEVLDAFNKAVDAATAKIEAERAADM